jgi:hypothetical protein
LYLLEELNASLQVHTKVYKDPINSFALVLLLFKNEHVVVEELLQLLVTEVDANLLEAIVLSTFSSKISEIAFSGIALNFCIVICKD